MSSSETGDLPPPSCSSKHGLSGTCRTGPQVHLTRQLRSFEHPVRATIVRLNHQRP